MTIEELYKWSLKHNCEHYDLMILNYFNALVEHVTKERLACSHEDEKVIIA